VGDWALGSGPGHRQIGNVMFGNGSSLYTGTVRSEYGLGRGGGGSNDKSCGRDKLVEYWFGSSSTQQKPDDSRLREHAPLQHDDGIKLGTLSRATNRGTSCVSASTDRFGPRVPHQTLAWGGSVHSNGGDAREMNGGAVVGGLVGSPGHASSPVSRHGAVSNGPLPSGAGSLHNNAAHFGANGGVARKLSEMGAKARGFGDGPSGMHVKDCGSLGASGGSSSLLNLLSSNGRHGEQAGLEEGVAVRERDVHERVAMVDALLPSPFCASRPLSKPMGGIGLGGGLGGAWGPGGLSDVLKGKFQPPIQPSNQPTIN
jgi:hypothetical protein